MKRTHTIEVSVETAEMLLELRKMAVEDMDNNILGTSDKHEKLFRVVASAISKSEAEIERNVEDMKRRIRETVLTDESTQVEALVRHMYEKAKRVGLSAAKEAMH